MRRILIASLFAAAFLACSSGGGGTTDTTGDAETLEPGPGPDADALADVVEADRTDVPDTAAEVPGTDTAEATPDVPPADAPDAAPDAPPADTADGIGPDVPPGDATEGATDLPEGTADLPAGDGDATLPDAPDAVDQDSDTFVPDIPDVVQAFPPRALPFTYTRPQEGDAIAAADTTAFTKKVAALWKKIGWFRWVLRSNFGVDTSTGKADFLAWHGDGHAVKAGNTVTFYETGGDDNMWIPGSVVLSSAMNGYLMTGDWDMAKVAEQFCKGLTGTVTGFRWDANDPAPWLMARTVFAMDQSFAMDADHWRDDGRLKAVDWSGSKHVDSTSWNAKTYEFPNNPAWGDVWVRTMRSKDDVRAITRMIPFLYYLVADAKDDFVKSACQETLDTMTAFAKDTVDQGYNMRTKGPDGVAYVIACSDQDLGSYVCYSGFDPRNECTNRLATDLIAYGEQRTNDCGSGFGSTYDSFACVTHYYNYPIVWDYHMAALGNSLVRQKNLTAWYLLDGLRQRIDSYDHPGPDESGPKDPAWNKDLALLYVEAASLGLPLTWAEAAHVQKHWTQAIADYQDWGYWDLWAATVTDGEVPMRPNASDGGVDIENLTVLLEYCNSPFRNPAGASFVDCAALKDPAKWGE